MTIVELAYVVLPLAVAILAAKFLGHIYGYPGYAIGFLSGPLQVLPRTGLLLRYWRGF